MKSTLIQQIEKYREKSRKAFAKYWEMSAQLTKAIACNNMYWVVTNADNMAHLLKSAANTESMAKHLERKLGLEEA